MSEERKNWIDETTLRQGEGIYLSKRMLRSKAFVKLTGAAKQILLESYTRLKVNSDGSNRNKRGKRFFAGNNGELKISYKSLHDMFGYSTATISKAIDQLTAKGFWSIVELGNGVKRQSHKIALIKNWQDYETEFFKAGEGKANKPVNGGFKKRRNLETTSGTKAGITSETKAVQAQNEDKPP
jgi:ribosome-associated protein YbcJ (S4-like RNA binding protein)